jgi:subtilisin family serine protease
MKIPFIKLGNLLGFTLVGSWTGSQAWAQMLTPQHGLYQKTPGIANYDIVVRFDPRSTLGPYPQVPSRGSLPQPNKPESVRSSRAQGLWAQKEIQGVPLSPSAISRSRLEADFQISYKALVPGDRPPQAGVLENLVLLETPLKNRDALEICSAYEKLPEVLYCDLVPRDLAPSAVSTPTHSAHLEPIAATSNWTSLQGYLNPAPQGVDALWAWAQGIKGQGVKIHDVEWAWTLDHEDLNPQKVRSILKEPNSQGADHGTAVLGEIMADSNAYGMTGIAFGVEGAQTYSERTSLGRVGAVARAVSEAQRGEILLLELQTGGCGGGYSPGDYNLSVWDLVHEATQKGVVVIITAGNGSENLDIPCYANYRNRGDHGAIIVGAGTALGRIPTDFTTYGSMVHVQGWGDWSVATLEYGGLFDGGSPQTRYTSGFSGTSSAAPIVTGAAALIQSWALAQLGYPLNSWQMRHLLVATGTSQAPSNKKIGPLPNVRAAIQVLQNQGPLSSSSRVLSSSAGIDCSGLPSWSSLKEYTQVKAGSADYVFSSDLGAQVEWKGAKWSTWWATKGQEPGVSMAWNREGFCGGSLSSGTELSSSFILSSSSHQAHSSAIITAQNFQSAQKSTPQWTAEGAIHWPGVQEFQWIAWNSLGKQLAQGTSLSGQPLLLPWGLQITLIETRHKQTRHLLRVPLSTQPSF